MSSTSSPRSRDFSSLPKEEITIASPAWVPVEEDEDDFETVLDNFSDSDDAEKEGESETEPRRRLSSLVESPNNNLSDDGDDLFTDDKNVSHECCDHEEEPKTNCCNLKGIGHTLARGFCRVVNTLVSCFREKLTRRQMFLLASAVIAAIFKTKNVAMDDKEDPSVEDPNDDDNNNASSASANNISADIVSTVVDAAIDSITSTDKN